MQRSCGHKKNSVWGDNSYKEKYSVTQGKFQKRIKCSISYTKYLSDILQNKCLSQEQNLAEEKKNDNQKKNNRSFHRKVERPNNNNNNNQNKNNKSFHRKVERLNNQNNYNRSFHRKVERPNYTIICNLLIIDLVPHWNRQG